MNRTILTGAIASLGLACASSAFALNLGDNAASNTSGIQLVRDGGGPGGGGGGGSGGGGNSGGGGGGGSAASSGGGGGGSSGGDGGSRGGGGREGGGSSGASSGDAGVGASSGRGSSFDGGRRGGDGPSARGDRGPRGTYSGRGDRRADRRHRHRGGSVGVYIGDGYGYSDCGWLRRKAIRTGSSYWWNRYEDCID
jgi:hypothetical protein